MGGSGSHDIRVSCASDKGLEAPAGAPLAFREGYRECVVLYALHAPTKRGVARILDEHCVLLEQACLASEMNRDDVARYEGFRQAIKDLRAARRVR